MTIIAGPIMRSYRRVPLPDRPRGSCQCDTCVAHHETRQRLSDGYVVGDHEFWLDANGVVHAGCRVFTIDEYRTHVRLGYPNTPKAEATLAILDDFEAALTKYRRAKQRRAKAKRKAAAKKPVKKARAKK